MASADAMAAPVTSAMLEDRLRGALWGLFAGDALAAPTHWYYGGARQIKQDYGAAGITGYTKPVEKLVNLRAVVPQTAHVFGGCQHFHSEQKL